MLRFPNTPPNSCQVAMMTGSAMVRSTGESCDESTVPQAGAAPKAGSPTKGDLLDGWMRRTHRTAAEPMRYEMFKDAMARGILVPILMGMEAVPEDRLVREELDAYVLITLGSCAHVILLCKCKAGDPAESDAAHAAGGRFEECSVMHATELWARLSKMGSISSFSSKDLR